MADPIGGATGALASDPPPRIVPPIAPTPGAAELPLTPREVVAAGIEPATGRSPPVLTAPSLAPCFRDDEAGTPVGRVTVSGKESFLL